MSKVHHAKAERGQFCDPIFPNPDERGWAGGENAHLQHRLICCDCGLAHDMEFIVVEVSRRNGRVRMVREAPLKKYTVQFRARRNERSTAQIRRKKQAKS